MPGEDITEWCKKNTAICVVIIIIALWFLYVLFLKRERMQGEYLDQIANQASNPMVVKYLGRERDPLGMSMRDYYLENRRNAYNGVSPVIFDDMAYANQTDYLQMPRWYRPAPGYKPRPLAALLKQDGNVVATDSASPEGSLSDIVPTKAMERMNQKNGNTRNRFFA